MLGIPSDTVSLKRNYVLALELIDARRSGAAPADERHFITAETLADYVNTQVLQWVRKNRPDHMQMSRGISRQIEGSMARVPLAVDPGGIHGKEQARQAKALKKLRSNLSGPRRAVARTNAWIGLGIVAAVPAFPQPVMRCKRRSQLSRDRTRYVHRAAAA